MVGISTPKLIVPSKFEPTLPDMRGWLIPMFGDEKMGRMEPQYQQDYKSATRFVYWIISNPITYPAYINRHKSIGNPDIIIIYL